MPTANTPCDQQQRHQALDPNTSFIVQAPAGSGKTELLVQRYLVLLSQAHDPEEVIAITFTRKAAAEMRARVLNSLQTASEKEYEPNEVYHDQRWQLAKKLHQHQISRGWDLLAQPHRLRIQTIDAFNAYLTCQMPISSGLGPAASLSETPEHLYRLAIQAFFIDLTQKAAATQALTQLLLHLDNDYAQTEQLLTDMLARRDQWLILTQPSPAYLRNHLERGLQRARSELIDQLNTLPVGLRQDLLEVVNFIRQQRNQPAIRLADNEAFWLDCLTLLLTKKNQWRKSIAIKQGLPASVANPQQRSQVAAMKRRLKALLASLSLEDSWRALLSKLRLAPPPTYTEAQWTILKALFQLLPVLVAQLQQVFQRYRSVDYIEVALRALQALGTPQQPTDLTMTLDYPIKHILIDEFQDTSVTQLRLLSQLTAGWQADDGRSLFLVGDPMQSIYRFRKAEVSLFNQVRQQGLGQLKLQSLVLQCNFRSTAGITDWINASFMGLLSSSKSLAPTSLSFTRSIAQMLADPEPAVHWHWLTDADAQQEAHTVAKLVKAAIEQNPQGRVAILVRARSHLPAILMMLRQTEIPYHALEIDSLAERSVIQDYGESAVLFEYYQG